MEGLLVRCLLAFTIMSITVQAETLTLADGSKIEGATITKIEMDKIRYSTDKGGGSVLLAKLCPTDQEKYGYDPVKIKKQQEQEKKNLENLAVWEPFPSALNKITGVDQESMDLRRELSDKLLKIQIICQPLMDNKQVDPEYVKQWCDGVYKKQIMETMPAELVMLSWGEPHKINSNSFGFQQWIYRKKNGSQYVYIKDGFVSSWSDM